MDGGLRLFERRTLLCRLRRRALGLDRRLVGIGDVGDPNSTFVEDDLPTELLSHDAHAPVVVVNPYVAHDLQHLVGPVGACDPEPVNRLGSGRHHGLRMPVVGFLRGSASEECAESKYCDQQPIAHTSSFARYDTVSSTYRQDMP